MRLSTDVAILSSFDAPGLHGTCIVLLYLGESMIISVYYLVVIGDFMRLWYWTSFITMVMLIGLNFISSPILQHSIKRTTPIHKTLYIDRNLSEDELDIITGAAYEWHTATNGMVNYDIVRLPHQNIDVSNSIVIVIVSADFPEIISLDSQSASYNHLGYYYQGGPIPYIALVPYRIEDKLYKTVVMHELGHSLGLRHSDILLGIGTLMYPNVDAGSNTITDADLQQFCQIYGCDANQLHDQ